MSTTSQWVSVPKPSRQPGRRLFCFPYAGGAASIYRGWADKVAPGIEVCPVQLPGRGNRLKDAPFKRIEPLLAEAADALSPYLEGSFAFFGHSMGAMISFELARLLRREDRPTPAHLFLSGRPAPQKLRQHERTYDLPEPEFIEELRRLKGTPQEVLEHPELMDMLSPILRADFELCETYRYVPEPPLSYPITAFAGLMDQDITREQMEGWREHTSSVFTLRMFPGDHFFLHESAPLLLQMIARGMLEAA